MLPKSAEPRAFVFRYQVAIRRASISSHAKLVAFVLSSYADADGSSVFPSQRTLASDAGVALSTIVWKLKELESAGWIVKLERARNGRGLKRSGYSLAIPEAPSHDECRPSNDRQMRHSLHREARLDDSANGSGEIQPAPNVSPRNTSLYRHEIQTSPLTNPDPRHAHASARGDGLAYAAIVQALVGQGVPQGQCLNDRGQRIIAGWVKRGITMPVLSQALARALRAKPGGNVPPAYLDPIVTELLAKPSGARHESSGRSRESGVDAFWRNASSSQ